MRRTLAGTAALLITLATVAPARMRAPDSADFVLTGRVTDAVSGAALTGARAELVGTRFSAITAANGQYRLVVPGTLPGGRGVLRVTRSGYQAVERSVQTTGSTASVDVSLLPGAAEDVSQPSQPAPSAKAEEAADAATVQLEGLVAVGYSTARSAAAVGAASGFAGPPPPYGRPSAPADWNREQYSHIDENGFVPVASTPLSTFSADVDRASYSNIRRFIMNGDLPPKDAVRIEEMVNYFPYDLPAPRGDAPFSITTEVTRAPWNEQNHLVRIALSSRPIETENLPASNLVFLIDVSGSMQSEDKLPLVKQSLRLLVEELRPRDRVAMVVYAGSAGLVLPSTSGAQKGRILGAIEELEAGGSTAGGAGLRLAYSVARDNFIRGGNNRVILATDGDFNVGVSSDAEMVRLVEEKRAEGTFLTVLGFGTGNLQDAKMEQMADHGNGNYAYIDGLLEAKKVLVSEMGGTLVTVAKDVKLQVEFNPARVGAYRLVGYENRLLATEDFNDDRKDAGEIGAGHTVTALYEIVPAGAEGNVPQVDPLRYQTPGARASSTDTGELAFVKVRYKAPTGATSLLLQQPIVDRQREASSDFTFAAAVAGFGMLLRDSEHRGSLSLADVLSMARSSRGTDPGGYRADFISLVERYRGLRGGNREPTD